MARRPTRHTLCDGALGGLGGPRSWRFGQSAWDSVGKVLVGIPFRKVSMGLEGWMGGVWWRAEATAESV